MKSRRIVFMVVLIALQLNNELRSQPAIEEKDEQSSNQAISRDIETILQSLSGPSGGKSYRLTVVDPSSTDVRMSTNSEGHLRVLGAPLLHHFPVSSVVPGDPQANAMKFLADHKAAFGILSSNAELITDKIDTLRDHSFVRFGQSYQGISIFGAQVLVQLTHDGHIEFISSDIVTDTRLLDSGSVPATPSISDTEAEEIAVATIGDEFPELKLQAESTSSMIYQPSVVGNLGSPRLVYHIKVVSAPDSLVAEIILVDAYNGDIALRYSLTPSMNRSVAYINRCDENGCYGVWARKEGEPEYEKVPEVDKLYDYLGDVYDFYFTVHGRQGIDNKDMPIIAYLFDIPDVAASWNLDHIRCGLPYMADDVIAHEYTHGVTQFESGLIYINESGAINESFSDIWGEWIDQINGRGNDSPDVKWLLGEDISQAELGYHRAIRNMEDPTEFDQPDRKSSPYWHNWLVNPKPNQYENDWGGVHTNSGVGNKLCYLLTDGGTFNHYTIDPMGILKTAELFYEVQTHLLTVAADHYDLYMALTQAAINLMERKPNEWNNDDLQNVERACRAVEIDTPSEIMDEQREYSCSDLFQELTDDGTTFSNIHIENVGALIDLNVRLDITHPRDEDLDVFLIAPDGTRIELFSDVGGTGSDFRDTVIDDDAILSISEGIAPFTGSYQPEQPLTLRNLYGTNIEGMWTLEITDDKLNERGILNSWSLDIVNLVNTVFAFVESFPSKHIDLTKWTVTQGTPVIVDRYKKNISVYSLKMSGGHNAIESRQIDLSSYSQAILSYGYQRTGWDWEGWQRGESPNTGADLIIEYWNEGTASWIELERQLGDGPDMYYYEYRSLLLPQEMLKADFALRIRTVGIKGDWFIDDVMIKGQL
ncbi:M4 family metallopeptidase [Planctomycetota bacterium]